jgi:hypothetical protein
MERAAETKCDYVALLLVLLAALCQPLAVRLLAEMHLELAVYLPTILLVGWVCLLRPDPALPLLTLVAIYLVQLPGIFFQYDTSTSELRHLLDGQWHLLGIPVAAVLLGYAAVLARKHMPLWRWPMPSEVHTLARQPVTFLRRYRWAVAILLIGALADMLTTIVNLARFGTVAEVHPAMRIMAELYGVQAGIIVGTVVRVLVVLFVASLWTRWCRAMLVVCGLLYGLAAMNNHFLWL